MATWLWTLSYAVDMWRAYQDKRSCRKLYHFVAWTFPAMFTFIGLFKLYTPNAKYIYKSVCHKPIFQFYYLHCLSTFSDVTISVRMKIMLRNFFQTIFLHSCQSSLLW